ncbi:DUF6088 family protein [Candidatus Bipolaricaulota bacterium]|nr:DUF6088 family protein [Candidatus Bipolaricaulota bacterium]
MNTAYSIADKILARLRTQRGPVPTHDFLDLGNRAAVDQSLSRLVQKGAIWRIQRGLYDLPRMGKLLNQPLTPSPDELVRAWAKNNGLKVVPSGARAANVLGLSTQVPAKIIYYTNGRTQTLKLGPYTVQLLNRGPKTMDVSGRMAPLVLQALRHIGRDGVRPEVVHRLRATLSQKEKAEFERNLHHAAAWMLPVIKEITGEDTH